MCCKAYSLLSFAAIRNGSYHIVLVVEFVCPRLNEKNSPGLPEYVDVKSRCHRRSILHTNCDPSPGALRVQSSMATGGSPSPANWTPRTRSIFRPLSRVTFTCSGSRRRLS
jgi:hypothetical protein